MALVQMVNAFPSRSAGVSFVSVVYAKAVEIPIAYVL